MEIGNEIGQKIRSAIRAKLVELGAYVGFLMAEFHMKPQDDELPDYVMVMVANRKSEAQMCEDLSLFLGANTSKFTAWLHGLLQKLLSITSAEPIAPAKEMGEMIAVGSLVQSASQPPTEAIVMNWKDTADPLGTAENQMAKTSRDRVSSAGKKKEAAARQRPDVAIEDEPVIRLSLDHDEFEEETRVLSEDVKVSVLSKGKVETAERRLSRSGSDASTSRRSESIKHSSRSSGKQSSKDALERKSSLPGEGVKGEGRKRHHGLESSVGAIVKHNIDEVDEAYDPLHPAIGSVASIVKVTERKSSVPPSLQANRMLLLLAMKEAEKSVAEFRKSSVSEIETDAATQDKGKTLSGSVKSLSGKRSETERVAVRQIPLTSSANQASQEERRRRKPEEFGDEENEKAVAVVRGQVLTAETAHRRPRSSGSRRNIVLTDETQKQTMAVEEEVTEEEEEQQLRKILIQQRQHLPIERTSSPKFVVTLDGIYQNAASEGSDVLPVEEEEDEALSVLQLENVPRNIVRVKPQAQMVEEEIENAGYEEEEEDDDEFKSLSKKSKVTERCKYWPSCKNGDSCPFHHPSIPCKMFPSCRFGDKCFYLHPSCKFDGICRNPACPYVHSAGHPLAQSLPIIMPIRMPIFSFPSGSIFAPIRQKTPVPAQPPKQVRCRFFPNCTDMNCAFLHPKACRYGLSCASKSCCPFAHPQLPTKKQLKWVSTSVPREHL